RGDAAALSLSRSAPFAPAAQSRAAASRRPRNAQDHGRAWVLRNRNAHTHALDARRRARLSGPQPRASRPVLRAAAITANLQADPDDFRHGPLFPDRALFPRRGLARRPSAGIYATGSRNVVSAPAGHFRSHRASDAAR